MVRSLLAMWETWVRFVGREDPLEKEMATHSLFLPRKSLGRRSLAGCSPWGRKESDTTELYHLQTLDLLHLQTLESKLPRGRSDNYKCLLILHICKLLKKSVTINYNLASLCINRLVQMVCCCLVAKSCLTLLPPGSSVHGISQARTLEWVASSFSRGSS